MKCVVLAAGYATRLYPLTENFPKPLLQVAGKPILSWLLDDIGDAASEFLVVSNHRFYAHFLRWREERRENIRVLDDGTETNEGRLGAVMDLLLAIREAGDPEDLLVIAGDNLLDFSLRDFIAWQKEKGTSALMYYREPDPARLRKCGVLEIGPDGRVLSMEEKPERPKSDCCCPPFYFLKAEDLPRVYEAVERGCGTDAPGSLFVKLSEMTALSAFPMPGKRYDIGDPVSYGEVCRTYRGTL